MNMDKKPFKGTIMSWEIHRYGRGAIVVGIVVKHTDKTIFPPGGNIQTSSIQYIYFKKDGKATAVTQNSQYTLI